MNAEEEIAEMLAAAKYGKEREDRAYADHRCVIIRVTIPPPPYDTAPNLMISNTWDAKKRAAWYQEFWAKHNLSLKEMAVRGTSARYCGSVIVRHW